MTAEFDRAVADHRAGKYESAAQIYRKILDAEPEHADAWHLLGLTLHQRGQHHLAVQTIHRALQINPRVANYHNSLGMALHGTGATEDAAQTLQRAVTIDPGDADAQNNLGLVLTDLRLFGEAEQALRNSLAIRPDHQGAIYNLGRVLAWQGEDAEALEYLEDAVARDPNNPTYWNMLGVTLGQLRRYSESHQALTRSIEIDPRRPEPHVNLAHHLLGEGRFEQGWAEHEWRLKRPEHRHRMQTPPWAGEDIAGRTILLWAEQGLGDAIQFVRYAPLVAQRGARVVIEAPPVLHGVFEGMAGVADVTSKDKRLAYDCHAALMSLPSIFGMTETGAAYLQPPGKKILESKGAKRVGLVWAGNPDHSNDRKRSHALSEFALLQRPGVAFFSLQVGPAAEQETPEGLNLTRLGAEFRDFSDTAAALAALDLFITVDTSVAHLAGALGVPTWLILPPNPDWR